MLYCKGCGHQLTEPSKFCPHCGLSVESVGAGAENQRSVVWEGVVHKCPQCGEPIKSFSGRCPVCGFEFRDRGAVRSVTELAAKIQYYENEKANATRRGFAKPLSVNDVNEICQQEASVIKAHPIPNNIEDIKEFVVYAATNIDPDCYSPSSTRFNAQANRAVSDAWLIKCEQAVQKATLLLDNSGETAEMKALLSEAKEKIRRAKRKGVATLTALLAGPWLLILILVGALVLSGVIGPASTIREQERLDAIVTTIEQDVVDGNYLRALLSANSLESNNSDEMRREWEINREYWMDYVVEEAGKNGVDLSERAAKLNEEYIAEHDS